MKKYLLEESYKEEEEEAQASSSFFRNFLIIGMAVGDQRLRWIGIDAKSDKVQHVDQLGKEPSFFIKPENSSNEKWWSACRFFFLLVKFVVKHYGIEFQKLSLDLVILVMD